MLQLSSVVVALLAVTGSTCRLEALWVDLVLSQLLVPGSKQECAESLGRNVLLLVDDDACDCLTCRALP